LAALASENLCSPLQRNRIRVCSLSLLVILEKAGIQRALFSLSPASGGEGLGEGEARQFIATHRRCGFAVCAFLKAQSFHSLRELKLCLSKAREDQKARNWIPAFAGMPS